MSIFSDDELEAFGAQIEKNRVIQDVDPEAFLLRAAKDSKVPIDFSGRILGGEISLTMDGASTVTIEIEDEDRTILNSGMFGDGTEDRIPAVDSRVGPWWFRLVAVAKTGGSLTLTFQDRNISYLQTHNKPRKVSRGHMTRAQFVQSMIREVKASKIEIETLGQLNKRQPTAKVKPSSSRENSKDSKLTVKGAPATREQLENADQVVAAGKKLKLRKHLIYAGLMTAITESTLKNVKHGDAAGPDSTGLFQQRDSWGPRADREDPFKSATLFYQMAVVVDALYPNQALWELCARVQRPAEKYRTAYAKYLDEARALYDALSSGDSSVSTTYIAPYEFHRGQPDGPQGEDSWECITRLADEVRWRAFSVPPKLYFVRDRDLMARPVSRTVEELQDGVDSVDFDVDVNKEVHEATVTCRVTKWSLLPGSVVLVKNCGIASGKWIVWSVERGLFDTDATITLRQPESVKKEPAPEERERSGDGSSSDSTSGSELYDICKAISDQHRKYVYGGGHGKKLSTIGPRDGLDCSSSCSLALRRAGFFNGDMALVSGQFASSWGKKGKGKEFTVHANSEHVWIEFHGGDIDGHRFDTSPHGDGESGPRLRKKRRTDQSRFTSKHWEG